MRANDRSVTVDRWKLIDRLKANLELHRKDYAEAIQGYRIKLKRDLHDALFQFDDKCNAEIENLHIEFDFPRNYEKDYLEAINMLEWSEDEKITLDLQLFRQYVQNEWSWSQSFDGINSTYKAFAVGAVGSARR